MNPNDGTVRFGAVPLLLFAVVVITGWSFIPSHKDPGNHSGPGGYGYRALSTLPNTPGKEPAPSVKPPERPATDDSNLTLPNTGLRDPGSVSWLYGSSSEYKLDTPSIWGYSLYAPGGTFHGKAVTSAGGKTIDESFDYKMSGYMYAHYSDISSDIDARGKMQSMQFSIIDGFENVSSDGARQTAPTKYTIHAEKSGDKLRWTISVADNYLTAFNGKKNPVRDMTIDAPPDGFFFYLGADAPSLVANLLASVNPDAETHPVVWALDGGSLPLFSTINGSLLNSYPFFTRVIIAPLSTAPDSVKQWWESSRDALGGWRPTKNMKTYVLLPGESIDPSIFYNAGNNEKGKRADYLNNIAADGVVAYLDPQGRLIRVEQIGAMYCSAAHLAKIDDVEY